MTGRSEPSQTVMAGLVPGIHAPPAPPVPVSVDGRNRFGHDGLRCRAERSSLYRSDQLFVEIFPFAICRQAHLPDSRPMLHVPLALDGRPNIRVTFEIHEPFERIALGEAGCDALPMLPPAFCKIARNARINRTVRPVRHDVDPGVFHCWKLPRKTARGNGFVDGRDQPGHDDVSAVLRVCFARY